MTGQIRHETMPLYPERRTVCGFWRRILAFLIDTLILWVVGYVLGIFVFDSLAQLGGWGRLVGFVIALLYLGILNSSIGGGQKFAKRLTKIKVIDRNGQMISLSRAFLRAIILETPFFLNGAFIPQSIMLSVIGTVINFLIFCVGGAIIYFYLFNRRTRQSLHDLVVGTYVVRASASEALNVAPVWKGHLAVAGILCLLVVSFSMIITPVILQRTSLPELISVQNSILHSGKVHFASVFDGQVWTNNGNRQLFSTNAIWKHRLSSVKEFEEEATEIAAIVLRDYRPVWQKDTLLINIAYGYDLGISSIWRSYAGQFSPNEWLTIVQRHTKNEQTN